jgi:hypothetical protein
MRKAARKPRSKPYKVGKGRPPLATRWKPGQSGNPKGRPQGARNVSAVLSDVLRQRVAVTENGKTRRMPLLEAMMRRLANDALRGNPVAVKLLLSIVERHAETSEARLHIEDLQSEDQAILARYLGTASRSNAGQSQDRDKGDSND